MTDADPTHGSAQSAEDPAEWAEPSPARVQRAPGPGRPLLALLAAVIGGAGVAGLAHLAVRTPSGQRLDQLILTGAQYHEGALASLADLASRSVSVPVSIGILVAALLLVLVRRRPGLLLPLLALVVGANLTTQVIKHFVLTRDALGPGIEITPNSFPSGHTTLAASAMVALVLASGRARAVLAPLGAAWTVAAGLGTLVVGWHRPSDVVGAIAVVAAWTFFILALDGLSVRRRRARAASRPGHGRRRRGSAPSGHAPPGHAPPARRGAAEACAAALLSLIGIAGLGYGLFGLLSLPLPLVLHDTAQQLSAFAATAALIAGGTAGWMALTLLLRAPISHRARRADRVP